MKINNNVSLYILGSISYFIVCTILWKKNKEWAFYFVLSGTVNLLATLIYFIDNRAITLALYCLYSSIAISINPILFFAVFEKKLEFRIIIASIFGFAIALYSFIYITKSSILLYLYKIHPTVFFFTGCLSFFVWGIKLLIDRDKRNWFAYTILIYLAIASSPLYMNTINSIWATFIPTVDILIVISILFSYVYTEREKRYELEKKEYILKEEIKIKTKSARIGEQIGNILHELNNPIGVLILTKDICKRHCKNKNMVARLSNSCKILAHKVETLKTSYKELIEDEIVLCNLSTLIEEELIQARFHASIVIKSKMEDVYVKINKYAFKGLIRIPIQNAIEELLGITDRETVLYIELTNKYCLIKDNGNGMPEHILSNIWLPKESSKKHGMGKGLLIAKEYATLLNFELLTYNDNGFAMKILFRDSL